MKQNVSSATFEVIVVDNNSNDDTQEIIREFTSHHKNFRTIIEYNQGLSYARNRGYKEAHGEWVAYIDDDAKAFPDWIQEIQKFIVRHPDIQVFGGPFYGYSLSPPPDWFPPDFGTNYLGDIERQVQISKEYITGTNMIFRRTLLNNMGGFRVDVGMVGDIISYGEETELFQKIDSSGITIYYSPRLQVEHLIDERKIHFGWLCRNAYAHGRCEARTLKVERSILWHLANWINAFIDSLAIIFSRDSIPLKRRLFYSLKKPLLAAGGSVEYLMIKAGKENL